MNQGGTADKVFYSSLTESIFLPRAFLFYNSFDSEESKEFFLFTGGYNMLLKKRLWRSERRIENLNQDHNLNLTVLIWRNGK